MPNEPEHPSPESAPSPSEAASSPASSRASRSEPAEPPGFVADTGPAFDPEAAAEIPPEPPPAAEPVESVQWEEETIAALLGLKGRALHAAAGVAEEDWRYTELDLAAIAPPLARICNRYEPIQRLAKYSDPMTLAFALGAYGVRSLEERQAELGYREAEADTQPIAAAGEPAAPASEAPLPETAPRQASSFPAAPPPPMQPSEGPAPPPPPRPAEAPINPTEVDWQVGG